MQWATASTTLLARAASTMAWHSASVGAMGFSTITCRPRPAAEIASGACCWFGTHQKHAVHQAGVDRLDRCKAMWRANPRRRRLRPRRVAADHRRQLGVAAERDPARDPVQGEVACPDNRPAYLAHTPNSCLQIARLLLPTSCASAAFERPHDIVGDPAAVEVAGLRLDCARRQPGRLHLRWIERDIVLDRGELRGRARVEPCRLRRRPARRR